MIVAGVIGWPVAHSKSPLIHRFWLAKLGIDGDYSRFPVHPDNLGSAIQSLRSWGLHGVNVTVPHKVAVMRHLDRVDDIASRAGAVNTVIAEDGGLAGYNTDVAGVTGPLRRHGVSEPSSSGQAATCLQIIGTGGAARAAVVGAVEAGCSNLQIFARSLDRAGMLVQLAGATVKLGEALPLASLGPVRSGTNAGISRYIVINATTLGMTGNDPVPIDLTPYPADTIVFDMVYSPLETPLLTAARALGLCTIDGLEMLVAQAAAAFELFFGTPAPREYDVELRALLTA